MVVDLARDRRANRRRIAVVKLSPPSIDRSPDTDSGVPLFWWIASYFAYS